MDWREWAELALARMDKLGRTDSAARAALEHVKVTGHEPYVTLKGYVFALKEADDDDG